MNKNVLTRTVNLKSLFLPLIFMFQVISVQATTKTVVGNTGQGWTVASNWSPSGVPQAGDVVIIPATFTISVKNTVYSSPFPSMIIKIYGTLDFDPSGKIDLSSTGILNIYDGGQITTNGTSSELVSIGGITKYNGQVDGNITGALFASSATGSSPNGFYAGVLAIKLLSFNYELINSQVKLSWVAIHDNPLDRFQVERNTGNGWVSIADISTSGNLSVPNQYSYMDMTASRSINLYRIKLLDANAHVSYSKTVSVSQLPGIQSLSAFPNPAGSSTTITWKNDVRYGPVLIQLSNATMSRLKTIEIPAGENSAYLDLGKYPTGLYTITLTNNADLKQSISLLKNN